VTSDPGDELVDVVDGDDRVIATVPRRQMRAERLRHRAVFIAVVSSAGQLLVHRRSDAKDLWPGRWDIGAGGVVAAGEDYDTAARRELFEEVGVDAVPVPLGAGHHVGAYADADVDLVARCYRVVHDGPITFVDGEVAEARWVDRAGLDALLASEPFVPDSVKLLAPEELFPSGAP
jgi:8-oxo-dGTP pyrophosphatase MutT (NUDIX family)